jgi:hypothetical protein
MTRALVELSRLSRALQPRAILVDVESEGAGEVVRELRDHGDTTPLLVYARATGGGVREAVLGGATDAALVGFVERVRSW